MSIEALRQRLKELGEKQFEDLCFQILAAKYPEGNIKKVDGAGGDKGADVFQGLLSDQPTIWQCKFFPNGVKDSQKKQIKKSLKTVLRELHPKRWVLCLPIDLSITAHSWFEGLQQENSQRLQLELFPAANLIAELISRPVICEVFFPEVVEVNSIKAMKALLLGTNELDDKQLSTITDETAQQYLQRLRDNDPRVDYEISYAVGSSTPFKGPPSARRPGLMLSVHDGKKRIDVFARDVDALRRSPPKMSFGFSPAALPKLGRFFKTGETQQFEIGEFRIASNSFDYLLPDKATAATSLVVSQAQTDPIFSFRVTAGNGKDGVRFNKVRFSRVRGGLEEVEFKSVENDIAVGFRVVLRTDGSAQTEMIRDLSGQDVIAAQKALHFEKELRSGGRLEILDRDLGVVLMHDAVTFPNDGIDEALGHLVSSLSRISDRLGVSFLVPEQCSNEDWAMLSFIEQVIEEGFGPAQVSDLTADVMRVSEDADRVVATPWSDLILSLPVDREYTVMLLGRPISLGSATVILEKPTVKGFNEFAKAYVEAVPGSVLTVEFEPVSNGQIWFPRYMKSDAKPPVPVAGFK